MTDQPVQVGVGWSFDVEVAAADVVDGFVVDHESTVGVLEGGVSGENGVVGFYNRSRDLHESKRRGQKYKNTKMIILYSIFYIL